MNWVDYANFHEHEFRCKCGCGATEMDEGFMITLQRLRSAYGKPMTITSGYRCSNHPAEKSKQEKGQVGTHSMGKAADVAIAGADAWLLLRIAAKFPEFTGIGVSQRGPWNSRFIHLDTSTDMPRPNIWSY